MLQSLSPKLFFRSCVLAGLCLGASAAQKEEVSFRWPREAPVKKGVVVSQGEHFVLHLQFENELAGKRAKSAVDAAWPLTMEFLGTPEHRYDFPLEIHIYDSKDQYIEVDRWLTGGNFKFNESFSHWNSLSAHVVMAPPMAANPSERFGLTSQTLEVLVHEAAHLSTYTVVPTYRYHPTWFSEGLAMHVEQATLTTLGLLKDPADHPRYATQQLVAKRLLDEQRVPNVLDLLVDELGDLSFHERYALWSDFMKVLKREGELFDATIRDLRNMRGGPKMRARMSQVIVDRYGAPFLERALAKELAHAPAHWRENGRSLETIGDEWEQVAFENVDARAWRTEPMAGGSYTVEGAFELLGKSSSMQLLISLKDQDYLCLNFREGEVALESYSKEGKGTLSHVHLPEVKVGQTIPFALTVKQGSLSLEVDGKQKLALTIKSFPLDGPWGLGVGRGGAGIWSGISATNLE